MPAVEVRMWWLVASAFAGESDVCRLGFTEIQISWTTRPELEAIEARQAAAEVRPVQPLPGDAMVMAYLASKDIDQTNPSRYLIVALGADESEQLRYPGEWRRPDLPGPSGIWRNYLGTWVSGPKYPMKVHVVDRVDAGKCVFTVEADGSAKRFVLPPVP
jgi:hypothetical protein